MSHRRTWPYLKTPLPIFLIVMLPVCALQFFLLAANTPNWMRISAGLVLVFTAFAGARGYLRRLHLAADAAEFRSPFKTIRIPWTHLKLFGAYAPNGRGTTPYVYLTSRVHPPAGTWDQAPDLIQLQDRPGLLDAIRAAQAAASPGDSPQSPQ